ncbi:MAG: nucleotide 5'-monophosphate nucleosidase PpnN [Gammaproteobacteria bacterium]|nr:nucleotide 5'-monophosphate nucleosidase PpnN [Gammaproteobacteria bacterium]MDH5173200.1 nucleotide 5'-monophosphate nucleosidase PpnN [Gammaproteobacteria bacterium]
MSEKIGFASVRPIQSLNLLSQREMASLASAGQEVHQLFRLCALAVLNTGSDVDNARELYTLYDDFEVTVVPESRGLKLQLYNCPAQAFVDGKMIEGIRSHLFSALRDIIFTYHKLVEQQHFDLSSGAGITDTVFRILRNAGVVSSNLPPRLVVCWGGHSISRLEYDFSKEVGYQLGLRGFDIATGCGAGAMKGPMKGATIGHAKQLNKSSRFVGISEPGIIAAESPNPLVNELVILPDIEKRLEAFVRLAHGVVVFPGGAGTAEELFYLLGVKMHPANSELPLPVVLAAPASSAGYFEQIDAFLRGTLGDDVARHYEIVCGDPAAVARSLKKRIKKVRAYRMEQQESFSYNWGLAVPDDLQQPFHPTHENMAALKLHRRQPVHELAAELRRAFSGIVAGNIKEFGVRAVEERGPYQLHGDPDVVASLGDLLAAFVKQGRMKLDSSNYTPCFELVS